MAEEAVAAQARDVLKIVGGVLGADAVGAYLHGSAALGGLGPHSDLDVFVVASRPMAGGERRALRDGLLGVSRYPATDGVLPVELTVVVQAAVRPWRYPPECEFQYGEWLRGEYERGYVPSPSPDADLALLITMVLLADRPLTGPPPAEVLDPVPHGDLVRAMTAGVPELLGELETDTRNVVLTLARVWSTLATGRIRSKSAAAEWALQRLPEEHRPVLARARAVHLGDEEERWGDLRHRLRPYADHVVDAMGSGAPAGVLDGGTAGAPRVSGPCWRGGRPRP
ncbi:aminoglycoside adenylyltransferase family protein [Actinomadura welshii]